MEPRSLSYIASACGGELCSGQPEVAVTRVCTDSRQARRGDLFIPLKGDRFDGHEFLGQALAAEPAACIVERGRAPAATAATALITVENTRSALGRLAARYRRDFALPVVAVGGSNGKTSTKELLAAMLREQAPTLWSEASFNNDVGVPLTLLRLESRHRAAVLEAGTNHPGELAPLLRLIQPRFGVITSIGREHLEFFGDLAGVAREEGWIAELLPADGRLFMNGDSEWASVIEKRAGAPVVRVGWGGQNAWRVTSVANAGTGVRFTLAAPRPEFSGDYELPFPGRHQALNAALALAVAAELGLNSEAARRGLANCPPLKMRMQLREAGGIRLVDDSYNANADSVLAALETLRELPASGARVAVLGDMAELGEHSALAHEEIGRRAAELGVTRLFAVGRWAGRTAVAARTAGLEEVIEFDDVEDASRRIPSLLHPGDLVLLKASRATGLERISEAIRRRFES